MVVLWVAREWVGGEYRRRCWWLYGKSECACGCSEAESVGH